MAKVTRARVIEAPVEQVWQALNDIDRTPEWVVGLEKAEIKTQRPYGEGSIYYDTNRIGSALQVTPWQVMVFEPLREQVHVSASKTLPSTMTIKLDAADANTWLEFTMDFRFLPKLGVVSRVFEWLVMRHVVAHIITQNLANLDAYLQQRNRELHELKRRNAEFAKVP